MLGNAGATMELDAGAINVKHDAITRTTFLRHRGQFLGFSRSLGRKSTRSESMAMMVFVAEASLVACNPSLNGSMRELSVLSDEAGTFLGDIGDDGVLEAALDIVKFHHNASLVRFGHDGGERRPTYPRQRDY